MKKVLLFLCALVAAQMANAQWYLTGGATTAGWTEQNPIEPKTEGSIDVWENINLTKDQGFKFLGTKGSWNPGYSISTSVDTKVTVDVEYTLHNGHSEKSCVWTAETGNYTITLDRSTKKFRITAGQAAKPIPAGTTLYLKPSSNWKEASARFAAYFFGTGDAWEDAKPIICKGVGEYQVTVPEGNWTGFKFVRMNPATSDNNWSNKWNETANLAYDGTKNLCIINGWDGSEMSEYTPSTPEVSLAGDINEWNTTATKLIADGEVYTAFIDKFSGNFKIVIDGAWFGQGQAEVNSGDSFELGTGDNMTWNGNPANVKVVVDMTDPAKYPVLTITELALPTGDFEANIKYGMYYLCPGAWDKTATWYAAQFVNANTGAINWVYGLREENEEGGNKNVGVYYGLQDEVNAYTHIMFCAMDGEAPEFNEETGRLVDEEATKAKMTWDNVVACSKYLTYAPAENPAYYRIYFADSAEWLDVNPETATGVNRVELANGIGYAYGVVSAEGAIEVYNVNGAVVARGNDTIDLRGLGRGVYIIRNGNQVRKVVR